ncbi:uncharacterized protein LOC144328615 [Podarcis muralis]
MGRFLALTLLLLSLSILCCTAKDKGRRFRSGHKGGEPDQEGHEPCSCSDLHGPRNPKKHGRLCPCDGILTGLSLPEQLHRHHRGMSKQHLHQRRHRCQAFVNKCHMMRVAIPL